MSFFLSVLGMALIVEGIPYFCFPSSVKSIARQLTELDEKILRSMGFVLAITGLVIIYVGRRII